MARHDSNTKDSFSSPVATTEPAANTPTEVAAGTAAAPDERYKKLTLDDAGSTFAYGDTSKAGQTVNRIDYIRAAWVTGKQSRGLIAKELTRLSGKKVTYQIVFSATKGVAGGPAPAPAAATAVA